VGDEVVVKEINGKSWFSASAIVPGNTHLIIVTVLCIIENFISISVS
jgi:hypothetical protein